jgi:hypothetical protein
MYVINKYNFKYYAGKMYEIFSQSEVEQRFLITVLFWKDYVL